MKLREITSAYDEATNTIEGDLYLQDTQITSLPDGLTVGGYLDLQGTAITSLPDGLTVGGNLYLQGTAITSLPDGLTVGGSLYLRGTAITSLPDGLTVGGSLYLRGTAITSLPDLLTVGGSLDLQGTAITSLPDGLTVGGSLYLQGTAITSLPDSLTVGGSLYLQGTAITSLPDSLTVGGYLDLRGTAITDTSNYKKLREGDYVEGRYLYADGILTHVAKAKPMPAGITYYVGKIKGHNVITDGKHYAHCKDVRSGILDLRFKQSDRDKSAFENLTMDSVVNFDDAVVMYRVITGACSQGTQQFVDGLKEVKESYTVREIVEVTDGAYGNLEFAKFFGNK